MTDSAIPFPGDFVIVFTCNRIFGLLDTVKDNPQLCEPQGPGTSKLDWRYFENNKIDRNELQVRKNLHKGTGTKMTIFFCQIVQFFSRGSLGLVRG